MRLFVFAIGNAEKKFQIIFGFNLHFRNFLFSAKKKKKYGIFVNNF